jgi:cell division protein FtsQ
MARARHNRRKQAPRSLPKLPKLPALPRLHINWRALFGLAALASITVVGFALARELVEVPVRQLDIEGSFQRVTKLEILAAAEPALEQGLLTLDLDEIRRRIVAIDWVDTVTLQRVWPDTLKVTYSEHRAAANWGSSGLLNTRGELFAEDVRHEYRELPKLDGPEGSHRRVAAMYLEVRDRLSRANLMLDAFRMDDRGAFSMTLAGGVTIMIGREDVAGRIDRFFGVAVRSLADDFDRVAYIDMRYQNGFAVGWRDRPAAQGSEARVASNG